MCAVAYNNNTCACSDFDVWVNKFGMPSGNAMVFENATYLAAAWRCFRAWYDKPHQ
jgi:hypothetical protein